MSNFEDPPAVQLRTLLPIMRGDDVIAKVQSSSDRIATLSMSVLQKLDVKIKRCQALIAVPSAELAHQISDAIITLGDYLNVQSYACVDATGINEDITKVQAGVHVVVGTPARMYDLINRRALRMDNIKIFCLDDANEMLSRGFEGQVYEGTWKVFHLIPRGTQVILLSPTMPGDLIEVAKKFMRGPTRTVVKCGAPIPRSMVLNHSSAIHEAVPDQGQVVDSFENMCLNEALLRGMSSYGLKQPSYIQERAIAHIVKGRDVIVQAQQRAGKTIALCIAILQKLDLSIQDCQALMLVPHLELALEIQKHVVSLRNNMNIECHACIGGTDADLQGAFHVVASTPSRVHDMINTGALRTHNIKLICIDDAEETVSSGFKESSYKVLQHLSQDVQIALICTTMPANVSDFTKKFMREPVQILVKHDESMFQRIRQYYTVAENEEIKLKMLWDLIGTRTTAPAVIFCNTKCTLDRLSEKMHSQGFATSAIHRKTAQKRREELMNEFRSGSNRLLVTSDSCTRITHNLPEARLVINYELPTDCGLYLRRMGCGHFGRKDIIVINFVTANEVDMLRKIEQHYNIRIEETPSRVADL